MPGRVDPDGHVVIHRGIDQRLRRLATATSGVSDLIEAENRVASAGTAQTLPDVATATINYLTLTSASCALTFPTAAVGKSFTLILEQDGTGGRHATWPGTVKWAGGGAAPVLTVAASQADLFTFLCYDGTNWAGFIAGQNI